MGDFSEENYKVLRDDLWSAGKCARRDACPGRGPDDMAKKYEAAIAELDCADGVALF